MEAWSHPVGPSSVLATGAFGLQDPLLHVQLSYRGRQCYYTLWAAFVSCYADVASLCWRKSRQINNIPSTKPHVPEPSFPQLYMFNTKDKKEKQRCGSSNRYL